MGILENIFISKISNLTIGGNEFSLRNFSKVDENENELCDSILENSLLMPIIIRYKIHDRFEVISGNRRLKSFRKLGLKKILSHVIDADDRKAFEISLIENIHTNKINPIDEAIAFKKYVAEFGWGGITDLAKRIFKSVSYVDRRIKLLDLTDDLKNDVMEGKLKPSIADELLSVKDANTRSSLTELTKKRSLSIRELRRIVSEKRSSSTEQLAFDLQKTTATVETKMIDLDQNIKRSFDQAIISIRLSLNKLSSIIDKMKTTGYYMKFLWNINECYMTKFLFYIKKGKR